MLKHVDDDGNLSILASDSQLVFVCDKGGHYWTVDAKLEDAPTPDRAGSAALSEQTVQYMRLI